MYAALAALDNTVQHNYGMFHIKQLVEKQMNTLHGCSSDFLMHKTSQTYYLPPSLPPDHLLVLRLGTNKHLADIFSAKSKNRTVLINVKTVNITLASFYEELYSSENGFDKSVCDSLLYNLHKEHLPDNKSENLNASENKSESNEGHASGLITRFEQSSTILAAHNKIVSDLDRCLQPRTDTC